MFKPRKTRGYVLASLSLVTFVLIVLSAAVLMLGTGSLRAATHDQQSEQAIYAAEAGLAVAAEEFSRTGELPQPYTHTDPYSESAFDVKLYENDSAEDFQIPGGPLLPPGTVYLLSTGSSRNGTSREVGALFRSGLGVFQVGALADELDATNATFDAYDSNLEAEGFTGPGYDPNAKVLNEGILASNESTGEIFDLADTTIDGGVLVGPGGDPAGQIVKSGTTAVGSESALTSPIEIDDVEIPSLPPKDQTQASENPVTEGSRTTIGNLTINPLSSGGVSFSNSCFSMSVQPNGDFVAIENPASSYAGGPLRIEGNIHDMRNGQPPTVNQGNNKNGPTGFEFTIDEDTFKLQGSWHFFSIASDGMATADNGPSSIVGGTQTGQMTGPTVEAPAWLTDFMTGSPEGYTENPNFLEPGSYDTVTIDSTSTDLQSGGVYVVKSLNVIDSGQLVLPDDSEQVTIYVTEELNMEGVDALVNATRKAPNLNVVYTGTDPVNLSAGSQAYFTLLAKDADIHMTGSGASTSDFYGALVGKSVLVENAAFHYDTATVGVGLGADSSTLTLLSRHR